MFVFFKLKHCLDKIKYNAFVSGYFSTLDTSTIPIIVMIKGILSFFFTKTLFSKKKQFYYYERI